MHNKAFSQWWNAKPWLAYIVNERQKCKMAFEVAQKMQAAEIERLQADNKRLRRERDALLACRRGEQRCHECPDTKCGDNEAAEAGEESDGS